MNKLLTITLLACGLLLLDIPKAEAHTEVRNREVPPSYLRGFYDDRNKHLRRDFRFEYRYNDRYNKQRRHKTMPTWLQRNKSFSYWYKRSGYAKDRRLSWTALFEIYLWQRSRSRYFYRY